MQTVKRYETDSYLRELDSTVLSCTPVKEGYQVVLDQTCFFPEGGGQPSDRGTLGGIPVLDVQIGMGEIYHLLPQPLAVGAMVHGQIDWNRRFDLMQQHSGEHLVSGIVHSLFGYDNVGFHMGERITVDWNGPMTEEQLRRVERLTNEAIWRNLPVEVTCPTEGELKTLPYRSKKELEGQVRIVSVPGVDCCACCGTHVARTGEIGLAKLLNVQKFRSGVRVEMLFGARALAHCNQILEQNRAISVLLSAKEYQTAAAVERLHQEAQESKYRCTQLENRLFQITAERYENAGDCLLFEEGLSPDGVRRLTVAVMERCGGRCAVFSGSDQSGYAYALGEEQGDLRELTKALNQTLRGRGGGKPFFTQGAVKATKQEIQAFFAQYSKEES